MADTPNLKLPFLEESQASAEVPYNEALVKIDGLSQIFVLSQTETDPPTDPDQGTRYLIPGAATGAWTGKENNIAIYSDGWVFVPVKPGMLVYVGDDDVLIIRRVSNTWGTIAIT